MALSTISHIEPSPRKKEREKKTKIDQEESAGPLKVSAGGCITLPTANCSWLCSTVPTTGNSLLLLVLKKHILV